MIACRDCKHFHYGMCERKTHTLVDYTTGEVVTIPDMLFAQDERRSWNPFKCGKKARYFKQSDKRTV